MEVEATPHQIHYAPPRTNYILRSDDRETKKNIIKLHHGYSDCILCLNVDWTAVEVGRPQTNNNMNNMNIILIVERQLNVKYVASNEFS